MTEPVTRFELPSGAADRAAFAALCARFRTAPDGKSRRRLTYLDTFDWRLYEAGGTLAAAADGGATLLLWHSRAAGSRLRAWTGALPAFAWDLPAGPLRAALAPLLEARRLLPLVTVELEGTVVRVLDCNEKTVARAAIERGRAAPPDASEARPLPAILRVEAVRGFAAEAAAVVRFLEQESGLRRTAGGEADSALAAIGRRPLDYSSKLRLALEPATRAEEATRTILRALLDTLLANEDGVRRDLDSEFLHDFRVAVRRTRSALGQIRGVLPAEAVARFRTEFAWLGELTGPTRDLDVHRIKLAACRSAFPPKVAADLAPFEEFLGRKRRQARRLLLAGLRSRRCRRLLDDWRAFLDGPPSPVEAAPSAERAIVDVASERIRRALRRSLKRGKAIAAGTPPEQLHALRIELKKLRYLLEFFRSLYEPVEVERLIGALKRLQDNLGDFNDLRVQQAALVGFAGEMAAEGPPAVATLLAMGRLQQVLAARQDDERQRFDERFAQFARCAGRKRLQALFAAPAAASA